MLSSGPKSYYDDYIRKKGSSRLIHDPPSLLTDRGAYVNFLEVQLERVSAACLGVQSYDQRFNDLQSNFINFEEKVSTISRLIALNQQCIEEVRTESDNKLNNTINKISQDNNNIMLLISNLSNRINTFENTFTTIVNTINPRIDGLDTKYNDFINSKQQFDIEKAKMNQLYDNLSSNQQIITNKQNANDIIINNNINKINEIDRLITSNNNTLTNKLDESIETMQNDFNKQINSLQDHIITNNKTFVNDQLDKVYSYINDSNDTINRSITSNANDINNNIINIKDELIDNYIDILNNNLLYINNNINEINEQLEINKSFNEHIQNHMILLDNRLEVIDKQLISDRNIDSVIDNVIDKQVNDVMADIKNSYTQYTPVNLDSNKSTKKIFTFDKMTSPISSSNNNNIVNISETILDQQQVANNQFKDLLTQFLNIYQSDQLDIKNKLETLSSNNPSSNINIDTSIKTPKSTTIKSNKNSSKVFSFDIPLTHTPKSTSTSNNKVDMSTSITPKSPLRSNRAVNKIDMSTATTPKALLSTKSTSTTPKLSVNTLVSTRSAVTSPITSKQIDIPIPILKTPKRLDSGIIDSSDQINNDAVKDDDPNVIVSGNSNNRFYRSLSISPSKIPRYIKHSKPWIPTNLFTSSRPALSSPPRSLSLRHSFSAPSRYKQLYNNRSIKSAKEFFGSKIDQDDCNENTMNSSDQSICSTSTSTSTTISLQSKEPYKTRLRMRQLTDHLRGSAAKIKK